MDLYYEFIGKSLKDYLKTRKFKDKISSHDLLEGETKLFLLLNDDKSLISVDYFRTLAIRLNSLKNEILNAENILYSLFPKNSLVKAS